MVDEPRHNANTKSEEDLCLSCGLCCKGILHDYVGLTEEELPLIEKHSLDKYPKEVGFSLPCPQFQSKCKIYSERPITCRNFKCGVLNSYISKEISYQQARQKIEQVETLVSQLDSAALAGLSSDAVRQKSFLNRVRAFIAEQEKKLGPAENFAKNGDVIAMSARLKSLLHEFDDRYF